jgi:hypothetical protein
MAASPKCVAAEKWSNHGRGIDSFDEDYYQVRSMPSLATRDEIKSDE